jgi:hypothetical protein
MLRRDCKEIAFDVKTASTKIIPQSPSGINCLALYDGWPSSEWVPPSRAGKPAPQWDLAAQRPTRPSLD